MEQQYVELKARLAEIHDLERVSEALAWDEQTMMPVRGAPVRAEHTATLRRIAHEKLAADETGRLLESLRAYEEGLDFDSDEASLIRVARRDYEKARRVPAELLAELARAGSDAYHHWIEARRRSHFSLFLPYLERNVELKRRYIDCFDVDGDAYDVLLDIYEPGMKTAQVTAVFDELKRELRPFIATLVERADAVDDTCLGGRFPVERQRELALAILERFGFAPDAWRLDPTVHPFAVGLATTYIRLTTRYEEESIASLFYSMHEFGHGLYEHGISPSLERTSLCQGASMGLHESQSGLWENLVGRSRPFWRYFYPQLQAAFTERFAEVDVETFYRAASRVQPSLIRIEADEATYNLHIILRFELEQEIVHGRLELRDLPAAWNARVKEYLGIDVPDDARGVLQDVHWAGGSFGYFPTYALGNIISVQLWEQIERAIPDLDEQMERGEFGSLRAWLRDNVHVYGRKFTTSELLERVTGASAIDPGPFIGYLKSKLGEIYGL